MYPKSTIKKLVISNQLSVIRKGFTLIELMVVISIIGILVAIGAVSYRKTYQLTRDSRRKADLAQIQQALESYRAENGVYPSTSSWKSALSPTYINTIPTDPKTGDDYNYNQIDSYHYTLSTTLETDNSTYTVTQP